MRGLGVPDTYLVSVRARAGTGEFQSINQEQLRWGLGGQNCLLVAKQHLHSFIDWHLLLFGEGDKRVQVVNLTLNQSVHCPEDRVQVRKPYPARDI